MRACAKHVKLVLGSVALLACGPLGSSAADMGNVQEAVAVLHPTAGNAVKGVVRFRAQDAGVQVSIHIEGLTPGKHGFHVHAYGDCSSPDGKAAGGHFNPLGKPHAGREASERHVGDLGNVTADASGVVDTELVDHVIGFSGTTSILGRGVIVHGGADDLTSQPSGAAGPRVACGVIGVAAPAAE